MGSLVHPREELIRMWTHALRKALASSLLPCRPTVLAGALAVGLLGALAVAGQVLGATPGWAIVRVAGRKGYLAVGDLAIIE